MPIREYECQKCHTIVELLLRASEPEPSACECGGSFKKIFSLPARPKFKGSGFFETDYKTKKGAPDEG